MLMQARHHFPPLYDSGETQESSTSTFFDAQPFSTVNPSPSTFSEHSFTFTDPFSASPTFCYPPNPLMNAQEFQAVSQSMGRQAPQSDWQIFSDGNHNTSQMPALAQNSRKQFRQNDRTYSTDLKRSPFAQHLPTPTNTPTQPAFLDAGFLNSNRIAPNAMAAALSMNSVMDGSYDEMPGYAHSTGHSVSSYGHDSPATPRTMNGEERDESLNLSQHGEDDFDSLEPFTGYYSQLDLLDVPNVRKFERTISDAYNDELYAQPAFTSHPTSKYMPANSSLLSPYRNSMNERLQAANQARSVSPLDTSQRKPSPFRQGSPYAAPLDFGSNNQGIVGTAAGVRQQQKREADKIAYQQHHAQPNMSESATISPKDAVLEYHETSEELDAPLYSATSASESRRQSYAPRSAQFSVPSGNFSFMPPSMPTGSSGEIPLFLDSQYRQNSQISDVAPDFPAHLISMETSASASSVGGENAMDSSQGSQQNSAEQQILRPSGTSANRGAYACTAQGCTKRFESPGKLQKHRRENHSTPQPHQKTASPRSSVESEDADSDGRIGSAMTSAALMQRNSQAGPHRCNRVNPSTGKPCNTIFSRPYDLTRHEDTIHNGQKKKVRCHLCTEEKTFSRNDALTRHMRVVHPEVDFPGKHRRRHMV